MGLSTGLVVTMLPVTIHLEEAEFEINADTIGMLKDEVEEKIEIDVSDWLLFQFGLPLPVEKDTKLEDFLIEDEQLNLHLVRPEEPPRNAKPRPFKTDRNRFIVKVSKDKFEMMEVKRQKLTLARLRKSNFFSTKERFGIVTHEIDGDKPGKPGQIIYDVYDVREQGYILIQTDEETNNDVVFLVKGEPSASHFVKLEPVDAKIYDENLIITPFQKKELRTGYISALTSGIQGAAAVGGAVGGAAI